MKKELFLVLVSLGLIIGAILAACQSTPLTTITPTFPAGSPTPLSILTQTPAPQEQPAKTQSPTPAFQATPAPTFSPPMIGPASVTPGLTPVTSETAPVAQPTFSVNVEEWRKKVLAYISEKYKVPVVELMVGGITTRNFPLTNMSVNSAKVVWSKGSELKDWTIGIDPSGKIYEGEGIAALQAAEAAAFKAKYGKFNPHVYDLLLTKGPDDRINVFALFKDQAAASAVLENLKNRGYEVSPSSRIVAGNLPKKVILELAQRDDVVSIDPLPQGLPGLDTAGPAIGAPSNWEYNRNANGSGITIGILEAWAASGGGTVDFTDPYVNRGTTVGTADKRSSHPTLVAGAAASNHPVYRGPAYKSTILSAQLPENGIPYDPAQALIAAGAKVINQSWGSYQYSYFQQMDRWFDWLTRYGRMVNVIIAGNEAANYAVRSPGKAYNVITVGGFDDKNTAMWNSATMYSDSSWKNPTDKENEKPELVAVGAGIYSTTTANDPADTAPNDWIIDSPTAGTSFAAPLVTGGVATLLQKDSNLIGSPEAVKAILMASAIHNIEGAGALVEGNSTAQISDTKDGAGGVSLAEAYRIVDSGWWEQKNTIGTSTTSTDFDANGWFKSSPNIQLTKYQRLRAAIAWDSVVDDNWQTDVLKTDLDLYLYRSSGQDEILVSTSFNTLSAVETIDYYDSNAPSSANYKIKIKKSTSNESTNHLGIAWWKGDRYYVSSDVIQELADPGNLGSTVLISVKVLSASEPRVASTDNQTATIPGGLKYYKMKLTYPPAGQSHYPVEVLAVLGGDSPFAGDPTTDSLPDHDGETTIEATASSSGYQPPTQLVRTILKLDGSCLEKYDFYQYFDNLKSYDTFNDETISAQTAYYRRFQRGDARADGVISIADAMFIAQYLAGMRPLGYDLYSVNALNAASPMHEESNVERITISDALLVAQYLALTRDVYFEQIKALNLKTNDGGRATVESGSLQIPAGGSAKIPITLKDITGTAGAGAFDISIAYDPRVIKVTSVTDGGSLFGKPTAYRIDASKGLVYLNGVTTEMPGLTKEGVLAYLDISAAGTPGQSTTLKVHVTTVADTIGNNVVTKTVDGTVTVVK